MKNIEELLKEIRKDINSQDVKLSIILRKTKQLPLYTMNYEFKQWIDKELLGYKKNSEQLPKYRVSVASNYGDFEGFGLAYRNQPIPLSCVPVEVRTFVEKLKITNGIRELEELIDNGQSHFKMPWSSEWVAYCEISLFRDLLCLDAWKFFSRTQVIHILESVRNILFDYLLDYEKRFIESNFQETVLTEGKTNIMPDPRKVFVVYGRNRKAYEAMVLFLQAIGLEAIDFYELKTRVGGSAFVGNIVRKGMDEAQAVIVLYTPDEYASLHPHLCDQHDSEQEKNRWQPRQNVILEAGMALAISEERTILVVFGNVSLPSDLHGRHYVRLSNSSNSREQLRALLAGSAVGCSVDFSKTTLHNTALAGDFESCFRSPLLPEVSTQSPFQQ